MKVKTVNPQQKRSKKTKALLLEIATEVFSKKGLAGSRIDEIAELSGLNKQRIYAYFHSKKGLYKQVLLKAYSDAATMEPMLSITEDDIPELTSILLNALFKYNRKHIDFLRILAWENLKDNKVFEEEEWKKLRSSFYIKHLRKMYEKGQSNGYFNKNIDFSSYLLLLYSFAYFYFANQLTISRLLNIDLSSEEIEKSIIKQVEHIITTGIAKEK